MVLKIVSNEFISRLAIKNCLQIDIENKDDNDSDEFVLPIDETKFFFLLHENIE
jgi:hypothetical protein